MAEPHETTPTHVPVGQRLLDNPWLLLVLGLVVMALFYTGWGLLEVILLPPGKLP